MPAINARAFNSTILEMDVETMSALDASTLLNTLEILSLMVEFDEFKGAWRAIGRIAPELLSSLRHVATIESIGSLTRIKGARLSDRDVEKLPSNLQLGFFAARDEQEVAGYADIMETIFRAYDAISITENHIRQFHRDLHAHSTKDERHRGEWKALDNRVEAFDVDGQSLGVVFATATPFDTPRFMDELVTWLKAREEDKGLVSIAGRRDLRRGVPGDPPISGWQRPPVACFDDPAFVARAMSTCPTARSKASSNKARRGTISRCDQPRRRSAQMRRIGTHGSSFFCVLTQQKQRLERKMERERVILGDLPELSVAILELARELAG